MRLTLPLRVHHSKVSWRAFGLMQLPELVRRQLPQGAMRANRVVVGSPCFNSLACVIKAGERMLIQTFFAQSAVETLDVRVLNRFARTDELQPDAMLVRPGIESARRT